VAMSGFYGADLARVHDEGFADLVENAAAFVVDLLRRSQVREGRVLDLGCGAGQLTASVSKAGYEAWGVDVSGPMIARARVRAPAATLVQGSIIDVDLPSCIAAAAVGEVLNYLPRPVDAAAVLRRVYRALVPGGLFVFDVAGPGRGGPTGTRTAARVTDDWAVVATSRESGRGTLERGITTFSRDGSCWRRSEERHFQNLYAAGPFARRLRRIGFRVRVRRGYGAYRLGRDVAVLIARKPS